MLGRRRVAGDDDRRSGGGGQQVGGHVLLRAGRDHWRPGRRVDSRRNRRWSGKTGREVRRRTDVVWQTEQQEAHAAVAER